MTIYTRFGSEVELLERPDRRGFVNCRRVVDDSRRDFHVSDLRADTREDQKKLADFESDPEAA